MAYRFDSNIEEQEYDSFVRRSPSTSFMQTSSWARVKDMWRHYFVGMYEDDTLVAAAMILERNLVLGKKLFYVPRGFILDYKNLNLLKEFTAALKEFGKSHGAIVLKIDPYICFSEENIQNIKKDKGIAKRDTFTKDTDLIVENLKRAGFKHGGYKKEVNAYIQPRYTMAVALKDENMNPYTAEALKKTFPKNTRNYIGKYQEERGVTFSYSTDIKDVKTLVKALQETENRQHIALRNEEYFKKIMVNFKDEAVLFFAHIDLDKYISFLESDMSLHEEKRLFCESQIREAKNLKEKFGSNPLAGATIVMMPTCQTGTKVASFLYAGTDTRIAPSLKITNGLMFYRLTYALERGCDYCDLGGVDGSLADHLSTFKSKFNPEVLELVGEFDLIISPFWNTMFNLGLHIFKYLRSKR